MAAAAARAGLSLAAVAMAAAIFYHFNFGLTEYMEPLKGAGLHAAHYKLLLSR